VFVGFAGSRGGKVGTDEKVDHRISESVLVVPAGVERDGVATSAPCIVSADQAIVECVGQLIRPLLFFPNRALLISNDVGTTIDGSRIALDLDDLLAGKVGSDDVAQQFPRLVSHTRPFREFQASRFVRDAQHRGSFPVPDGL
jgi:hypothetical protein